MIYVCDHENADNIPITFHKVTFDQSTNDLDLYAHLQLYNKCKYLDEFTDAKVIGRDTDAESLAVVKQSIRSMLLIISLAGVNGTGNDFVLVEPNDSDSMINSSFHTVISWLTSEFGINIPKFTSIDNMKYDDYVDDIILHKCNQLLEK